MFMLIKFLGFLDLIAGFVLLLVEFGSLALVMKSIALILIGKGAISLLS